MKRNSSMTTRRTGRGFTLVETLVALLCLSIGLLGVAALQMTGLKANLSAGWRSQSTYLAYDIIDRIRANRTNRATYTVSYGPAPAAVDPATRDLAAWKANVTNTLPGGDGKVAFDPADDTIAIVTITWDDSRGQEALLEFTTRTRL